MWLLLTIAAAVSWFPVVASADESKPESPGSAFWWGGALNLSRPLGDFEPPGEPPQFGFGAHLSFQPESSRFGMRIEFGMTSSEVSVDNVPVEVLPGFTSNQTVRAGNDLWWFLIGAQWDPRPKDTSVYAFTSLGALHVSPEGAAGGDPIVHPVVPGLPPSSNVFACNVGLGTRAVTNRLGLNVEVEYLYGAATDYVGSAGVEGSSPTHYASRNSSVGLFVIRMGIVRLMH